MEDNRKILDITMIVLISNKDKTRSLLLGENENDRKVLRFLYDNNICWGYYAIWEKQSDMHSTDDPKIQSILKKFPATTAVGFFSSPEGFVPYYDKKDLTEKEQTQQQTELFNFLNSKEKE